jgi:hypothetical protein
VKERSFSVNFNKTQELGLLLNSRLLIFVNEKHPRPSTCVLLFRKEKDQRTKQAFSMKRPTLIISGFFFCISLLGSCKSHERCPAYGQDNADQEEQKDEERV